MPEPVTISTLAVAGLGWVAGAAAGGVVEGVSGQAFSGIVRATKDRIAGLRNAPESQEVARAVRIAQMQALERVIRDFQAVRPERFGALFARPGDFFERSLDFCARAIGRSKDVTVTLNVEVTPTLTAAIDGLLAVPTPGGPADQHAGAVAALAENAVLEEMVEALDGVQLPDGFEEHFRNGSRSKPRFLDLFAIYITEQIRENQRFRSVLNSVQLARIESLALDTRELATRIEERFGAALDRLESKVDEIGASVDRLDARFELMLKRLSEEKGVPPGPLLTILERLGEENVSLDQIPERLAAKADEFLILQEQLAKLDNIGPDLTDVQVQALALINEGNLAGARDLLAEARQRIRALRQERSREEAALLAREAEIDRLELRYVRAAEKYQEAAELVSFDHETHFGYLFQQAGALFSQGEQLGDNEALHEAIAVYLKTAALKPRAEDPLGWAVTQSNLGNALLRLGERESGPKRLEESVEAYRAALGAFVREQEPLAWARTQNNLGSALLRLGEREIGVERLEEAVEAFHAALEERKREQVPYDWAVTQNNLGHALSRLGGRERGTARLKQAVKAFRAALEEHTREQFPYDWAVAQSNLGNTLAKIGERERGTKRLEAAVKAHRAALEEHTRERVPLAWGVAQSNLGNALLSLGEREGGTQRLEEAVEAYQAALGERTRKRVPFDWARTQNGLGNALLRLGEREEGTRRLKEAVEAHRAALEEYTLERVPLDWALAQNNLGNALLSLGEREDGTQRLEEAVEAFRAALGERTRERVPLDWAVTQNNLAFALLKLSERESGTERLEEAVEAYRAALEEFERGGATYYAGRARSGLTRASELLAQRANLQREDIDTS